MANSGKQSTLSRRDFIKTVGIGIGAAQSVGLGAGLLQLTGCGSSSAPAPQIVRWPIASQVYTTAQRQVCPVAVPPSAQNSAMKPAACSQSSGVAPPTTATRLQPSVV